MESQDTVLNTDDDGGYEVILAGEVVVHLRLTGRCGTSDLIQAHRRNASLNHEVCGGLHDPTTRDSTFLRQWQLSTK